MKALILAGGRGRRLGRMSKYINKCMLQVHNKPLIEYSLDCASALEAIEQIVIVVGYRPKDIVKKYGRKYNGKDVVYYRQIKHKGLVHAIECAKDALGNSDFMLMLGDELMINPKHKEFVCEFMQTNVFVLCGVVKVQDTDLIRKTYTVIQSQENRVYRLIEKPNHIFNNIMGTGNCIFKKGILDYIRKTPINQNRKEKELPDLIQCAVDEGEIVSTFAICSAYINVNSQEELKKTESYFAHF
jgi:dTDP-glucose pyrophosphorylase